ncbi:MAG: protein kinase, partial [Opitutales bacterium]
MDLAQGDDTLHEPAPDEGPSGGLSAGDCIGDYVIEGFIGAGAMAQVYMARQRHLGQRCAIKLMSCAPSSREQFERFLSGEGRTLALLDHPNIVRVLYAGTDGGRNYIALEYADGGSLEGLLRERGGRLPPREVRGALLQILSGLACAHSHGVVHRDLKPANVLRKSSGQYLISDFDLALSPVLADAEAADGRADILCVASVPENPDATIVLGQSEHPSQAPLGSSAFVGTIDYMSPELRTGSVADARSDIYSVGVMAYRMLTGRSPVGAARAPSELVSGLPKGWDKWVFRCLEFNPGARFQSAGEALDALRGLQGRSRLRRGLWLGAAALGTLAALLLFTPHRDRGPSSSVPAAPRPAASPELPQGPADVNSAGAAVAPATQDAPPGVAPVLAADAVLPDAVQAAGGGSSAEPVPPQPSPVALLDEWHGGLIVRTVPGGAALGVGDARVVRTPALVNDLEPGAYSLTISKEGYETVSRSVEIVAGQFTDIPLMNLTRSTGSLLVESDPASLRWEIVSAPDELPESMRSGVTPASLDGLPTGRYLIEYRLDGWSPVRETAEVLKGCCSMVSGTIAGGSLVLDSQPEGADVFAADGSPMGRTPLVLAGIPTGPYDFRLRLRGFREARVNGVVEARLTLRLNAVLDVMTGAVEGRNWTVPDCGVVMLWVEPGSFTMGGAADDPERLERESPQHSVRLSQGFWLGRCEVTLGQWRAVMDDEPSYFQKAGPDLPVERVSRDEALEFCRRVSERERKEG